MKKFLSLLLAAIMLLSCVPAMAEDAEWKIDQYTGLVSRQFAAEKLDSIVHKLGYRAIIFVARNRSIIELFDAYDFHSQFPELTYTWMILKDN